MARLQVFLLLIGALMLTIVSAGTPTFCKCTCGKNSTIIPLGPASEHDNNSRRSILLDSSLDPQFPPTPNQPRSASSSCSECTKTFCLNQGIDFCKDKDEDDVTTVCFKRDSNKDRIIVWGFIIGTVGLLGWASFKRFMEWRQIRLSDSQNQGYASMSGGFR